MSFEKIIGNEKVKKILNNAIETKKVMHSYMFLGTSGIGKSLFAKEFAQMILCSNEQKPCKKCESCIKIESNNNPDLIEIEPIEGAIKIEAIRRMQEKILEKPIISNRKVYIIKDADHMTKEAQNSLLKTLEEPPNYITIIMIGSNESMFLNTIKSRCAKINFSKISNSDLKEILQNKYSIKLGDNLIKACDGSIGKALMVNEKKEQYEEASKIFANIEKYTFLDVIKKLEYIYNNKGDIYENLEYINIILIEKAAQNPKYLKYIEAVEQTKKKLKANSNYDMSIDDMLYRIWEE